MSEEINSKLGEIQNAFAEFKTANDERLKQIEAKGSADVVTANKTDAINTAITELKAEISEMQKKANRPAVGEIEGSDAEMHRKAYGQWARKGLEAGLLEAEAKAMAGSTNSGADGGYAVPSVIDSAVYTRLLNISPMRSLATVETISTPNFTKVVNRRGADSGWVSDVAARTATNTPLLQQIAVPIGEIYANPAATQQILDDAFFDLETFLANNIADEFAQREGDAFVNGDGANKPKGFLSSTIVATADATRNATSLQYVAGGVAALAPTSLDPIIALIHSLKAGHRAAGASFTGTAMTAAALRSIKYTTGEYAWQESMVAGLPSTLCGYAFHEDESMPNIGANAYALAFGNFKAGYTIVDRVGIRTTRDPYTNKPYVQFYTTKRVGGCVVDYEAIKLLKIAVS
jgi:HK97 family phage major capsid protein